MDSGGVIGFKPPRVRGLWWVGIVAMALESTWEGAVLGLGFLFCALGASRVQEGRSQINMLAVPLIMASVSAFMVTSVLKAMPNGSQRSLYLNYSSEKGWLPAIVLEDATVMFCTITELFSASEMLKNISGAILTPVLLSTIARATAIQTENAKASIAAATVASPFFVAVVTADTKEVPLAQKRPIVMTLAAMPIAMYISSLGWSTFNNLQKTIDAVAISVLPFAGIHLGGGNLGSVLRLQLWNLVKYALWAILTSRIATTTIQNHSMLVVFIIAGSLIYPIVFRKRKNISEHCFSLLNAILLATICMRLGNLGPLWRRILVTIVGLVGIVATIFTAIPSRSARNFATKALLLDCIVRSAVEIELRRIDALPTAYIILSILVGAASCTLWRSSFRAEPKQLDWCSIAIRCHIARLAICAQISQELQWMTFAVSLVICEAWPPPSITPDSYHFSLRREKYPFSFALRLRVLIVFLVSPFVYQLILEHVVDPSFRYIHFLYVLSFALAILVHPLVAAVAAVVFSVSTFQQSPAVIVLVVPPLYYFLRLWKKANVTSVYVLAFCEAVILTLDILLKRMVHFTALGAVAVFTHCFAVGVTALSVALPTYLELVECSSAAGRVRLWISLSIAIFPPACMFALLPLPISPTLPDRFRLVGEDAVQSFLCDLAAVYTTGFVLIAIACRLGDVLAGYKGREWTRKLRFFAAVVAYFLGVSTAALVVGRMETAFLVLSPILFLVPVPGAMARRTISSRRSRLVFAPAVAASAGGCGICAVWTVASEFTRAMQTSPSFSHVLWASWQLVLLFIALAGPWYTLSEYILGSGRVHQRGAALVLSLASILPLLLASSSAAIEVSIMGIAQCGYIAFLESNMTLLARQLV